MTTNFNYIINHSQAQMINTAIRNFIIMENGIETGPFTIQLSSPSLITTSAVADTAETMEPTDISDLITIPDNRNNILPGSTINTTSSTTSNTINDLVTIQQAQNQNHLQNIIIPLTEQIIQKELINTTEITNNNCDEINDNNNINDNNDLVDDLDDLDDDINDQMSTDEEELTNLEWLCELKNINSHWPDVISSKTKMKQSGDSDNKQNRNHFDGFKDENTICEPISDKILTQTRFNKFMDQVKQSQLDYMEKQVDYIQNPNEKPPFNYAQLIAMAMMEQGRMTLKDICQWIQDRFAYFRCYANWNNSIRHNLSLHFCFTKVARNKNEKGKGGYWELSINSIKSKRKRIRNRKKRLIASSSNGQNNNQQKTRYKKPKEIIKKQQQTNNDKKTTSSLLISENNNCTMNNNCDIEILNETNIANDINMINNDNDDNDDGNNDDTGAITTFLQLPPLEINSSEFDQSNSRFNEIFLGCDIPLSGDCVIIPYCNSSGSINELQSSSFSTTSSPSSSSSSSTSSSSSSPPSIAQSISSPSPLSPVQLQITAPPSPSAYITEIQTIPSILPPPTTITPTTTTTTIMTTLKEQYSNNNIATTSLDILDIIKSKAILNQCHCDNQLNHLNVNNDQLDENNIILRHDELEHYEEKCYSCKQLQQYDGPNVIVETMPYTMSIMDTVVDIEKEFCNLVDIPDTELVEYESYFNYTNE